MSVVGKHKCWSPDRFNNINALNQKSEMSERKNILLFLGSGVSYKTGLPSAKTITDEILNGQWHRDGDSNFYPGKHFNYAFDKTDKTPKLQIFLQYIKTYADKYFFSRGENEANYEDIFYIVKQIHDEITGESSNPAIELFIVHINEKYKFESNPDFNYLGTPQSLEDISWKCIDFINCAIWKMLSTRNEAIGFDLIGEIINAIGAKEISIATLNHDTLLEKFLEKINIHYVDGFDKPDGDFCVFNPDVYKYDKGNIKLFKLHGSINIYKFRHFVEKEKTTYDFFAKFIGENHWRGKNRNGNVISNIKPYPLFLTGTGNKLESYQQNSIFRRIHLKFYEVLDETNFIIMSGYGWNDKGINTYLFEWIMSSPEKRLILLHENPELLEESKSGMWHSYDDLVKWGRLIPIKKWMSDTKLEDISKYLN